MDFQEVHAMADPAEQAATQLANIESSTGKTVDDVAAWIKAAYMRAK